MYKRTISSFFLVLSLFTASLSAEEVELQVTLKNGTTGGVGSAEKIKLFALERQMIPLSIGDIGPVKGSFRLPKVEAPDGLPILLQVTYGGVNYNKIVPPVPVMRTQPQEVTVFEKTQDRSLIKTKSLLQITRSKDSLIVFKVFILQNNSIPPRSFQNESDPIEIFTPAEASDVSAQLTQGAGMGIPLQLRPGKQGLALDRPILPGSSQLYISYSVPATNLAPATFKDKLLFEKNDGERVVFAKPKDMELSFGGARNVRKLEADVPEDVKAYSISYSAPQQEITISVKGGQAVETSSADQERSIENGKFFVSAEKTVLGVVAILGLLFTLSFLFVYRKFA
ncbi:hypothetical protein LEP1GSC047_2145 [Leptospira inadai serovar Lyme str. 10]|uniref:Oxygen tolerance protein n=2 Tax=Leptospira inadai serovar Lyme TaxID=293084 RepID=V6HEY7_9LEPT|nr:hypothetical protein [Leptospira inadai]EQA38762.1 hypothetical protein LEP1GSC047_2145 [Leptospira inadai serovar Lyme str. 10]PNV74213.1 hypothetical protein BES34_014460 [Leptospira inadai serovar Lyme]